MKTNNIMKITLEKMQGLPRWAVLRDDKVKLGVVEWSNNKEKHVFWASMYYPNTAKDLHIIANHCQRLDNIKKETDAGTKTP